MVKKLEMATVRDWVLSTTGKFHLRDARRDLQINTEEGGATLRTYISRLKEKEGLIKALSHLGDGWYILITEELKPMNLTGDRHPGIPVLLPFGINRYCRLLPRNAVLINGTKSSGKTAVALNIVKQNMGKYAINYYSSEMGEDELRLRLLCFDDVDFDRWNFMAYRLNSGVDFGEIIDPDKINIIDFLEIHEEYWRIGLYVKQIIDKLDKGLAFIAIQKNQGAEFPLGGERAQENARLIINLDRAQNRSGNVLTLKDVKNWADGIKESPNGTKIFYKIVNGAKLIETGREETCKPEYQEEMDVPF